jgi:triacylglycerol lipase
MTDFIAIADRVRELGREITPEGAGKSREIYGPLIDQSAASRATITRDISYGPDPRHRLDLFQPKDKAAAPRPVIVFVHGGGFVRGDKHTDGAPFYSNIGLWAAGAGMIGVTITYRLAPEHRWPSGVEDLGRVVAWLRAHVAEYGGDPEGIVLMGISAGAVHVASYVAFPEHRGAGDKGIAGAVVMSGIYDFAADADSGEREHAYFAAKGKDLEKFSSLPGLVKSDIPLMITISEYDPARFQGQALGLVNALFAKTRDMPRFVRLMGQNHFTSDLHFGSGEDYLGRAIVRFVREVAPAAAAEPVRRAGS